MFLSFSCDSINARDGACVYDVDALLGSSDATCAVLSRGTVSNRLILVIRKRLVPGQLIGLLSKMSRLPSDRVTPVAPYVS